MKPKYKIYQIVIIFFIFLTSKYTFAVEHFVHNFHTNKSYNLYLGNVTINGDSIEEADEIGVFVDDGNNGELLIGSCNIGIDDNPTMYRIYIYGDDDTNDETKNGAYDGDELTFKLYKPSSNTPLTTLSSENYTTSTAEGLNTVTFPLKFVEQVMPTTYGYLNISVNYKAEEKGIRIISVPALDIWGQIIFMSAIVSSYFLIRRKKHYGKI